jgi:hypothetical protein
MLHLGIDLRGRRDRLRHFLAKNLAEAFAQPVNSNRDLLRYNNVPQFFRLAVTTPSGRCSSAAVVLSCSSAANFRLN